MAILVKHDSVQIELVFFSTWFRTLRSFSPYPWQAKLFQSIRAGYPPDSVYIPTGGGKTDVITIWLLAVLQQIQQAGTTTIPRRMYFAIDRRTVVDQTEQVALDLLCKVKSEPVLFSLLQSQTPSENPLVVSILRGQRVTEQEPLIADPSAFAIVLCTPDMCLSRLLFSAYGCSPRVASREAGLVGHDAWVVLDEAHLSDAGRRTLEFVRKRNHGLKSFWHTCMSATPRGVQENALTLNDEDLSLMTKKLQAHKIVKIQKLQDKEVVKNVLGAIEEHSTEWNRLIIYVEKPKHAAALCKALSDRYNVRLLTGTMRGLEKSRIDFSPFKGTAPEKKSILVCTSAGEVGLDISADFLITEFTFLERLLQRLGRLNRWGECGKAHGYVLMVIDTEEKSKRTESQQEALNATLSYLEALPQQDGWIDVSGHTLYQNPATEVAFSPVPDSLTLNEAILAQLVNTSVKCDIPVSEYIRGATFEYHVNLVIRKDQELDALVKMGEADLQNYVASVPVLTPELFKEPVTKSLLGELRLLLGDRQFLFVSVTGEPAVLNPSQLGYDIREGTLYLPDTCKCIDERGMFSPGGTGAGDVFGQVQKEYRRFVAAGTEFTSLDTGERFQGKLKELLKTISVERDFKAKVIFNACGLLYVKTVEKQKRVKMTLKDHSAMAAATAEKIIAALKLNQEDAGAIIDAAREHDEGKAHPLWQTALRGTDAGEALAKLQYFYNPKLLAGMRHELVSGLDSDLSDLTLWLVVSHHGRCRPSFPTKAYDPNRLEESAKLNGKLPFIFEKLTKQYGYWGLAYLEALLRASDIQSEEAV
jgi:CRISPR-associated endonuclease/helicase Cas3